MQEIKYSFPMFSRLEPRTEWRGGRITDIDVLPLEEAARMASKHAGQEVTPADFLRAAGRGEISLHAVVHRTARVRAHDGGVYCNKGTPNENIVPAGCIPILPLTACKHLADTGRASWRTFDGFEEIHGVPMRYAQGLLTAEEPDFETVPADCRVTGYNVRALADTFCDEVPPPAQPQAATPAPVANETPAERRARWLDMFEAEEKLVKRGALQRLAKREGVDRSNMAKDIAKARAERADQKRAGVWASQLVQDGKRKS